MACNDNEVIEASVEVTGDTVRLEWTGGNVHSVTVGESAGASADAECDPGRNVWWAKQLGPEDAAPLMASPLRVGDAREGVSVSVAPALSRGKHYVARFDRRATAESEIAHGCVGFDF